MRDIRYRREKSKGEREREGEIMGRRQNNIVTSLQHTNPKEIFHTYKPTVYVFKILCVCGCVCVCVHI